MDARTTLGLGLGCVVNVTLPLRGSVCVWRMREILIRVREIELEESGGVVGEWTGSEEGDIAHDTDGVWGGRHVC